MQQPSHNNGILVIGETAGEFRPHLQVLAVEGVAIRYANNAPEALEKFSGQDVLLGEPTPLAEVLPAMPGVRWVQSTWAGVTPILSLGPGEFVLTGVKQVFGPQMAEFVFGYLLERELDIAGRRASQQDRRWDRRPTGSLQGKWMGVMGTGSIGACIARRALAFGMHVIGYSRSGRQVEPFSEVFAADRLQAFLAVPDYVVAALPHTPQTDGLLDATALSAMRNDCYLVNVGRGNLLDEAALASAVAAGQLAGAVLDVFQQEPLPAVSPLWDTPGISVTAHVAARSHAHEIAALFVANYRRYISGQPLHHVVDYARGY